MAAALLIGRGAFDSNLPPHRRFSSEPTSAFLDKLADHIKRTGQPETFLDLYRGHLPKDTKYKILRRVTIDAKKRPLGDMAPCPMCTPNRFLTGVVAYCYEIQVVAVIGHCCAHNADAAEREFKRQEVKRCEEDYLLNALPLLEKKRAALLALQMPAAAALKLYRLFRRATPAVHQHLREIVDRGGGRLRHFEVVRSAEDETPKDYFGPAGFRGRGEFETETRDHDFGVIAGTVALLKDYNPVKELEDAIRTVESFEFRGDENAALDFVVKLDGDAPKRRAAVAICQTADDRYRKFSSRLTDFLSFWNGENLERLNRYGTSGFSLFPFQAFREDRNRKAFLLIKQGRDEMRAMLSPHLSNLVFPEWTFFTFRRP